MHRYTLVTLLGVTVLLGASSPAFARDRGSWNHTNHYLREKVIKLSGGDKTAPGCDLVAGKCRGTTRNQRTVHRYFETLRRMIAPPTPEPVQTSYHAAPLAQTSTAPVASSSTGGTDAIPSYISDCVSGGDYNARNSSGAYGKYQIMPGTAAGYGCDLSTPAGQDACAAKIYANEGASPWACG